MEEKSEGNQLGWIQGKASLSAHGHGDGHGVAHEGRAGAFQPGRCQRRETRLRSQRLQVAREPDVAFPSSGNPCPCPPGASEAKWPPRVELSGSGVRTHSCPWTCRGPRRHRRQESAKSLYSQRRLVLAAVLGYSRQPGTASAAVSKCLCLSLEDPSSSGLGPSEPLH